MANTEPPNPHDYYTIISFPDDVRRHRLPGGWFMLFCVLLPVLVDLFLFLLLLMVAIEGEETMGLVLAAIIAGVALPFGLISFVVAVVIRDVAIRRNKKFSPWWMLPSALVFLIPMAIWLAVILKEGGMRLG